MIQCKLSLPSWEKSWLDLHIKDYSYLQILSLKDQLNCEARMLVIQTAILLGPSEWGEKSLVHGSIYIQKGGICQLIRAHTYTSNVPAIISTSSS